MESCYPHTHLSENVLLTDLPLLLCISGTEQVDTSAKPLAAENKGQQKVAAGPKHKRILCFDSSGEGQPQTTTISTLSPATNTSVPAPQPKKDTVPVARTRPNILGGNRPKRRLQPIRCPKDPPTEEKTTREADKTKEPLKKTPLQKQVHKPPSEEVDSSQHKARKQSDSERRSKSVARKPNDEDADGAKAKEDQSSRAVSAGSERHKEKEESSKKEPPGKVLAKPREGRVEKEVPRVKANKENEAEDPVLEQQTPSSSSSAKAFNPQAATPAVPDVPQPKTPKALSKTSSLAKQAAEMLHDIQGHSSPSEHPGHNQEESSHGPRTPGRQKKGKDGEGTPKHHLPPNTPDVPSCSPASEAGSENSINMAAHTLMILSRATIARTGTPLKDSLRQDGGGDKIPTSSKNSKKRKLSSPAETPPAKKDRVSSTQKCWVRVRTPASSCLGGLLVDSSKCFLPFAPRSRIDGRA